METRPRLTYTYESLEPVSSGLKVNILTKRHGCSCGKDQNKEIETLKN